MPYAVHYYRSSRSGKEPAREYIEGLPLKERAKVKAFIQTLAEFNGYLDEPYTRKVVGTKFRELIVDFGRSVHHRVFYFTSVGQTIILLHGFLKTVQKTPPREIEKGNAYYCDHVANHV